VNKRYYKTGGILIEANSTIPFGENTFADAVEIFRVEKEENPDVFIKYYFELPKGLKMPKNPIYSKTPWTVSKEDGIYKYFCHNSTGEISVYAEISEDYKNAYIYNRDAAVWNTAKYRGLTTFAGDQLFFSNVLMKHNAFYLHSSAVTKNGRSMIFVGESGAGKTTIARMFSGTHDVLCEENSIIRNENGIWRLYGSWNYSGWGTASSQSTNVGDVFFINQAKKNEISPMTKKEAAIKLLDYIVRPVETAEWWQGTLDTVDKFVSENNFYNLFFDKTGGIVKILSQNSAADLR